MGTTQLPRRLREHGFNRLRKALEAVHAGNEDILHAAVLEFGDDLQPELGPLGLGHPQTQQFLLAIEVHAQGQIDRLALKDTGLRP